MIFIVPKIIKGNVEIRQIMGCNLLIESKFKFF